jgi:hypothetical protein
VHEPIAEHAVAVQERRVLLVGAFTGEVALGEHGCRVDGADVGDRAPVHDLRVRRVTGRGLQHRSGVDAFDDPARHLAEVHVVHRGEPAQQLAARPGKGANGDAEHLVGRVGLQPGERVCHGAVVQHHQVVGDRRQIHGVPSALKKGS